MGLLVSGGLVVLTCVQVLGAASWDVETAQAIVSAQDSSQILAGTLLGAVGILAPGVVLVGALHPVLWLIRRRGLLPWRWSVAVAVGCTVLVYHLTPVFLTAAAIPFVLVSTLVERRRVRSGAPARARKPLASGGFVVWLFVYLLILLPLFDPWLATERLETTAGGVRTMYVLDDSAQEWVLLDAASHQVIWIDRSAIESRSVCSPAASLATITLRQLLRPHAASCP